MKIASFAAAGALTALAAGALSAAPAHADTPTAVPFARVTHGNSEYAKAFLRQPAKKGQYISITQKYDGDPSGILSYGGPGLSDPTKYLELMRVDGGDAMCRPDLYEFYCDPGSYGSTIAAVFKVTNDRAGSSDLYLLSGGLIGQLGEDRNFWSPSEPSVVTVSDELPLGVTVAAAEVGTVGAGKTTTVPVTVSGDRWGVPADAIGQRFALTGDAAFATGTVTVDALADTVLTCRLSQAATVLDCPAGIPALKGSGVTLTPTVRIGAEANAGVILTSEAVPAAGFTILAPADATATAAIPVLPAAAAPDSVPPAVAETTTVSAGVATSKLTTGTLADTGGTIADAGLGIAGILAALGAALLALVRRRRTAS